MWQCIHKKGKCKTIMVKLGFRKSFRCTGGNVKIQMKFKGMLVGLLAFSLFVTWVTAPKFQPICVSYPVRNFHFHWKFQRHNFGAFLIDRFGIRFKGQVPLT